MRKRFVKHLKYHLANGTADDFVEDVLARRAECVRKIPDEGLKLIFWLTVASGAIFCAMLVYAEFYHVSVVEWMMGGFCVMFGSLMLVLALDHEVQADILVAEIKAYKSQGKLEYFLAELARGRK